MRAISFRSFAENWLNIHREPHFLRKSESQSEWTRAQESVACLTSYSCTARKSWFLGGAGPPQADPAASSGTPFAKLVRKAEEWRWSSLFRWQRDSAEDGKLLTAWPVPRKANWIDHVNLPQSEAELQAVRRSVQRGCPFGDAPWSDRVVRRLGLETTIRPRGRPPKGS